MLEQPRDYIIGTAGHVDHGKTTLTRALTGVDTDRLKEERERELSIELGFAPLTLPSGRVASVVDVPGHERFIKNMVAGVTGMDLVVLVIAADEGIMPQTREHMDIVSLLGVRAGLVALTKADMVDGEWLELMSGDVERALAGTPFEGAPIIPCSGATGVGCDLLASELDRLLDGLEARDSLAPFTMPIDRAFIMRGFGTVVTGSVARGTVHEGDEVDVLPRGISARVRSVQVHNRKAGSAHAGQRAALNLQGVPREQVDRGDIVCAPGSLAATSMLDVELRVLPSAPGPVKHWDRVRVHIGTAEVIARVAVLGEGQEVERGATGYVQLRLESPTAAAMGTRLVLRSYSPAMTIAGGAVMSPTPLKHQGWRRREAARELALRSEGGPAETLRRALLITAEPVTVPELARELGLTEDDSLRAVAASLIAEGLLVDLGAGSLVGAQAVREAADNALSVLETYHRHYPLRPSMDRGELRAAASAPHQAVFRAALQGLVADGAAEPVGTEGLRKEGHAPRLTPDQEDAAARVLAAVEREQYAGLEDETVAAEAGRPDGDEITRYLVERGDLVRVGERLVHHGLIDLARAAVVERFRTRPTLKVSELRDILGSSRKAVVPLMEHFDSIGLTVRQGDDRVPGKAAKDE